MINYISNDYMITEFKYSKWATLDEQELLLRDFYMERATSKIKSMLIKENGLNIETLEGFTEEQIAAIKEATAIYTLFYFENEFNLTSGSISGSFGGASFSETREYNGNVIIPEALDLLKNAKVIPILDGLLLNIKAPFSNITNEETEEEDLLNKINANTDAINGIQANIINLNNKKENILTTGTPDYLVIERTPENTNLNIIGIDPIREDLDTAKTDIQNLEDEKQNKLKAGSGIEINSQNEISVIENNNNEFWAIEPTSKTFTNNYKDYRKGPEQVKLNTEYNGVLGKSFLTTEITGKEKEQNINFLSFKIVPPNEYKDYYSVQFSTPIFNILNDDTTTSTIRPLIEFKSYDINGNLILLNVSEVLKNYIGELVAGKLDTPVLPLIKQADVDKWNETQSGVFNQDTGQIRANTPAAIDQQNNDILNIRNLHFGINYFFTLNTQKNQIEFKNLTNRYKVNFEEILKNYINGFNASTPIPKFSAGDGIAINNNGEISATIDTYWERGVFFNNQTLENKKSLYDGTGPDPIIGINKEWLGENGKIFSKALHNNVQQDNNYRFLNFQPRQEGNNLYIRYEALNFDEIQADGTTIVRQGGFLFYGADDTNNINEIHLNEALKKYKVVNNVSPYIPFITEEQIEAIETNTAGIATNTTATQTNAANIATNTTNILKNTNLRIERIADTNLQTNLSFNFTTAEYKNPQDITISTDKLVFTKPNKSYKIKINHSAGHYLQFKTNTGITPEDYFFSEINDIQQLFKPDFGSTNTSVSVIFSTFNKNDLELQLISRSFALVINNIEIVELEEQVFNNFFETKDINRGILFRKVTLPNASTPIQFLDEALIFTPTTNFKRYSFNVENAGTPTEKKTMTLATGYRYRFSIFDTGTTGGNKAAKWKIEITQNGATETFISDGSSTKTFEITDPNNKIYVEYGIEGDTNYNGHDININFYIDGRIKAKYV